MSNIRTKRVQHNMAKLQMAAMKNFSIPEVNFTNILHTAFTNVSCARSFFCLRFRFVLYKRKTVGAKAAHRTLVKLTPGLDFTNILRVDFSYES